MAIAAIEMGTEYENQLGLLQLKAGQTLMARTQLLINNNFPKCAVTFKPTNAKNAGQ